MPEPKAHTREIIPEHLMLSRLAQSEQMREFFIQMWIQNPALDKQGGIKVQNLLPPLQSPMRRFFTIPQPVLRLISKGMENKRYSGLGKTWSPFFCNY